MLVNTGNYFEHIKKIGEENLSAPVKKMHDLIAKVTQDGKDWSKYQTFKSAWDKQFEMIDLLSKGKSKEGNAPPVKKEIPKQERPVFKKPQIQASDKLEEKAHAAAIDLIQGYVKRGDSYDDIRSGQMGYSGTEYSAMIKGQKIHVDRIGKTEVNYSWTLQRIFNEIKESIEKGRKHKVVHSRKHGNKKITHFKGKGVELVSPEVVFIKRFALLHGKEKNRQQVLNFIKSIQKAIAEKKIRKSTKFSKVIQFIQTQLVKAYNKMGESIGFNFSEKDYLKYLKMAGAEYLMPSVRFIKSYIGMLGQSITKQRAAVLLERINAAFEKKQITPSDRYIKHLRQVMGALERFLKTGDSPQVNESQLNGLNGVLEECGCNLHGSDYQESYGSSLEGVEHSNKAKIYDTMTVDDVKSAKYTIVPLAEEYEKLIGKICLPFHILVHGLGGSGKTSWALLFAQHIASLGFNVLYVAGEQYNTPTFTEMMNRLNIRANENYVFAGGLDALGMQHFDLVVIDSKDHISLSLSDYKRFKEQHPGLSTVIVSHSTKLGDFTGSGGWRNMVDTMVMADEGLIRTGHDKNRWGGHGEMRVYPSKETDLVHELSGVKRIKGKTLKINWTEPEDLDQADWYSLKKIKAYCDKGEYESAMEYAMYNCDTEIREAIPPNIWLEMGGNLTRTGEERLRKLLADPNNWK